MPKLRHTSAIGSPSRSRATNRKRSSTTEHSFHGINTSRQRAKSVTHVSGTKCHPCLGPFSAEHAGLDRHSQEKQPLALKWTRTAERSRRRHFRGVTAADDGDCL